MIEEYAYDLAIQIGIKLSKISLVKGLTSGSNDVFLLNMFSHGHKVSSLLFDTDMKDLENGFNSDRLEIKIRSALSRLKLLLES